MTSCFFPNHGAILNAGFFASAETTKKNIEVSRNHGDNTGETQQHGAIYWSDEFSVSQVPHNSTNFYVPIRMTVSAEFNQLEFRPARLAIAQGSMH